jgi:RNA polymerase sigma factor (sigma-70 family)
MRARQTVTEMFSTFLLFSDDKFSGWATDAKLNRSIKACLANFDQSEEFLAVYWHKQLQSSNSQLALGHMSAYLQESCYWSIYKLMSRLQDSNNKLSDFFQIAIAGVSKILSACNPDVTGSLKAYASTTFANTIRDYLRQNREANFCTDWGLLLKISRKVLIESLQHAGHDPSTIERYVLAWTCYTHIYLPQKSPQIRQRQAPSSELWQQIAVHYNQIRHQLSTPGNECTKETIERWITECGAKVRKYLYPSVKSLNSPKPGYDEGEVQDDLVGTTDSSLLTELIEQEEQATRVDQKKQINTVLQQALTKLDDNAQQLLQLYYQQNLTQQQIAKQLAVQQYTVSRKLSKTRESLLLALTSWSQETLHITVTSDVVKYISATLEEWLQTYYTQKV